MKRALAAAEVATVRIDRDGRAWINGAAVPNFGVHIDIEPDDIATVTIKLPLILPDGEQSALDGDVRVVYVASLDLEPTVIEGRGATTLDALRDLVARLETPT